MINTALKFIDIFFSGQELEQLLEIMTEDCQFRGPLFSFDCAKDYVNALTNDPPTNCHYHLIEILENENNVCVWYRFEKGEIVTPMVQLFEFHQSKIRRIGLVFDTAPFTC